MLPLLNLPFAFFGHSLGAIIGYELAKKINGSNALSNCRALLVSACAAPSLLPERSSIHTEPDAVFIEHIKGYGALPSQLLENKEALQVFLPRIRADFAIFETYRYEAAEPLKIPIVACSGSEDAIVDQSAVAGWKSHTSKNFIHHSFPGGHFYPQTATKQLCDLIATYFGKMNRSI